MSNDSFESELSQLHDRVQNIDKVAEVMAHTVARFESFLESAGLELTIPDAPPSDDSPPSDETIGENALRLDDQAEAYREDSEHAGTDAKHKMMAYDLAAIWLMHEKASEVREVDADPLIKKRLQAHLIVHGYDAPWLQLVDQEFVGEPLTDQDGAILTEAMLATSERRKTTEEAMHVIDEMALYLTEHGVPVGVDELGLVYQLTFLREHRNDPGQLTPEAYTQDLANARDMALAIVLKANVGDPAWIELIARFFPTE